MSENYTTKIFIEGDNKRYFVFLSFAAILILSHILKWSIFDKPSRLLL